MPQSLTVPVILDSPAVLYAILGDGEERPALEALVAQAELAGAVQFLGECDDDQLVDCYQQCDVFALPNRQVGQDIEGFGMVLLEAQACGRPVIAGASGGTAETMRVPETGRVVDCSTPAALAALVAEWLADPPLLARMGRAARAWAVENFDWSSLARQAEELFRRGRAPAGARAGRRTYVPVARGPGRQPAGPATARAPEASGRERPR
jgi:phosphatidylinositol alpha-1,6-mannosyltransferase